MAISSAFDAVIQEEESGCGIAAVANIVGLSYQTVRDKAASLGIFANDEALYSDSAYVRQLLFAFGLEASAEELAFSSWEQLPDTALLAIKYYVKDDRPFWHWVVFRRIQSEMFVLDSAAYLKNHRRDDFEAMSPRWSIAVNHLSY